MPMHTHARSCCNGVSGFINAFGTTWRRFVRAWVLHRRRRRHPQPAALVGQGVELVQLLLARQLHQLWLHSQENDSSRGYSSHHSSTKQTCRTLAIGVHSLTLQCHAPSRRCSLGVQTKLPPGWPLPSSTEVWVLTSSSGRAAMTLEARAAPYRELASRLRTLGPWTPVKPNTSRSVVGASKLPMQ